ncbi:unnamed protein product [Lampetra fluviatilis]
MMRRSQLCTNNNNSELDTFVDNTAGLKGTTNEVAMGPSSEPAVLNVERTLGVRDALSGDSTRSAMNVGGPSVSFLLTYDHSFELERRVRLGHLVHNCSVPV